MDLFSDVADAGALPLAATSADANLLAVIVSYPSSYSALAASAILAHHEKADVPIEIPRPLSNATVFDGWSFEFGEYASKVAGLPFLEGPTSLGPRRRCMGSSQALPEGARWARRW
ncbi:hypothetical protein VTI74DRAFT_1379 [Chaetomium olivicolor]